MTASMVELKNGRKRKNLTPNNEPQRQSWERRRKKKKDINPVFVFAGGVEGGGWGGGGGGEEMVRWARGVLLFVCIFWFLLLVYKD